MIVCGIDEAGRGPLAGPVAAASVMLPADFPVELLNDSKKMSEKKRLAAAMVIKERALCWGIGWVWEKQIDRINILRASLLAMRYAYESMIEEGKNRSPPPELAVIDGTFSPDIPVRCLAKPKADATEYPVMAASILAKTARDSVMCKLARLFPEYGYEKHKGYPTAAHRAICAKLGPSPIQRLSFGYVVPVGDSKPEKHLSSY